MKKAKLLVKELARKSIPVSQQTFDFTSNAKERPSDQYIVDGPALRELLKAYNWKYSRIRKHKDWVSTFYWNGKTTAETSDSETPAARAIWAAIGIIMVVSYLVFVTFLNG